MPIYRPICEPVSSGEVIESVTELRPWRDYGGILETNLSLLFSMLRPTLCSTNAHNQRLETGRAQRAYLAYRDSQAKLFRRNRGLTERGLSPASYLDSLRQPRSRYRNLARFRG